MDAAVEVGVAAAPHHAGQQGESDGVEHRLPGAHQAVRGREHAQRRRVQHRRVGGGPALPVPGEQQPGRENRSGRAQDRPDGDGRLQSPDAALGVDPGRRDGDRRRRTETGERDLRRREPRQGEQQDHQIGDPTGGLIGRRGTETSVTDQQPVLRQRPDAARHRPHQQHARSAVQAGGPPDGERDHQRPEDRGADHGVGTAHTREVRIVHPSREVLRGTEIDQNRPQEVGRHTHRDQPDPFGAEQSGRQRQGDQSDEELPVRAEADEQDVAKQSHRQRRRSPRITAPARTCTRVSTAPRMRRSPATTSLGRT
ncbi:hypothetical protein RhoFasK5_03554|nr:hypothetical protein [Rhodococcus kroppenstedtii]